MLGKLGPAQNVVHALSPGHSDVPTRSYYHHHQSVLWGRHLSGATWETDKSLTFAPHPPGPMCDLLWSDPQPQVSLVSCCGCGLHGGVEPGQQSPRVSCSLAPTRMGAQSASGA